MAPPFRELRFGARGFSWLGDEELSGRCDDVPGDAWTRKRSGSHDLWVYTDGPEGSGHYWTITIGIAEWQHAKPLRGFCLEASTVGWKTLQTFQNRALPWLEDVDKDGNAEVIFWDSFALSEEPTSAELGVTGWVYRLASEDSLTIDWNLSKTLAREVAKAYRSPLDHPAARFNPPWLGKLRAKAAEALEQFADGRCSMAANEAH